LRRKERSLTTAGAGRDSSRPARIAFGARLLGGARFSGCHGTNRCRTREPIAIDRNTKPLQIHYRRPGDEGSARD